MQIVIDISENIYNLIAKGEESRDFVYKSDLMRAILKGTLLPKRHGNLFDENDFEKRVAIMTESMDLGYGEIMDIIDEIPTIVKADKRK